MTVAPCNGVGFVLLGRRENLCAPQRGWVFVPLERGGNGCAPHFFFSCERKRNVPPPVQRKRERGAAFVAKAAPFSFVLYVLTVVAWCYADWFTTCAAAANERTNDWIYVDL